MSRRYVIWLLLSVMALASMLALPAPARARSAVVHSEPADGAVLPQAPQMLQVWFDGAAIVEPGAISLTDAAGKELPITGFHSDIYKPNDAGLQSLFDPTFLFLCSLGLNSYPTTLMVHLPALGPGTYRMSWRVITIKDRQYSSGSLVFAIDPRAPASQGDDLLTHSSTTLADDLMVTMAIRPNRPGANFISLQAAPLRRPLRAPVARATLILTPPGAAPREVEVTLAPDGKFLASGDLIDRPGTWTAEVRLGRGVAPATLAQFSWEVPGDPPALPLILVGAAVIGAGLAGGILLRRRRR